MTENTNTPAMSGSIFLRSVHNKRIYQLFRSGSKLRLYRIGNAKEGIDRSLVQKPDELRPTEKGDFVIPENAVIRLRCGENGKAGFQLRIRTARMYLRLVPLETAEVDIQNLLEGFAEHARVMPAGKSELIMFESRKGNKYWVMQALNLLLTAFVLWCAFSYQSRQIPLIGAILPYLMPFGLLMNCIFPGELTLNKYKHLASGRVDISIFLVASSIATFILTDFYHLLNWPLFIAICGVVMALYFAVTLIFTFDWRDSASVLIILAIVFAMNAAGQVLEMNRSGDALPIKTEVATLERSTKHSSRRSRSRYYAEVYTADNETAKYRIPFETYLQLERNDAVEICYYDGALGIPYIMIEPLE